MYKNLLYDLEVKKFEENKGETIIIYTIGGNKIEIDTKKIKCNEIYMEINEDRGIKTYIEYKNIDYIEVVEYDRSLDEKLWEAIMV